LVAALSGSPRGAHLVRSLQLIDVATATHHTIARADFDGVSFSPDSTELVYGKISGYDSQLFPREDLFVAGAAAAAGPSRRLTVDIASGKESRLPKHTGLEAAALARDGSTVLGTQGAVAHHPESDVVTLPATGGNAKVLVRNAAAIGWTR
jgi:hypothetical protein